MDIEALKAELSALAARGTWTDNEDFNPYDLSGGNFDDAYWGGCEDGETNLAGNLLAKYFGEGE